MDQQQTEQLRYLFSRYVNNLSTKAEYDAFLQIVNEAEDDAELKRLLSQLWEDLEDDQPAIFPMQCQPISRRRWPRIAAAASVLVALGVCSYYFLFKKNTLTQKTAQVVILPGRNKAILTLANGQQISLTDAKAGKLGANITKTKDNHLIYSAGGQEMQYNTVSTPRGGQWPELRLPDGTKVMLDASSSITYPVAFNGNQRKVKVSGQAYFEVSHDAKHPFIVETDHTTIKDIGTQFNVNSYPGEPAVLTTLIEGAVSVNEYQLLPGEQAQVKDQETKVKKADIEAITAWKQNLFLFRGQTLRTTMQQIARWYDVEIEYEIDPDRIRVGGRSSRQLSLDAVLEKIAETGVARFRVTGRKITVTQ